MKTPSLFSVAATLGLVFFLIPYLPKGLLRITDTLLVRFALLVVVIAAVGLHPLVGILTFLVVANLFIQRNNVKIQTLTTAISNESSESPAVDSIVSPSTAPAQPPFQTPSEKSVPFMPQEDSGENAFHAVAESLNEKQVLPTESVDGSDKAIAQLFEWVNPGMAQEA